VSYIAELTFLKCILWIYGIFHAKEEAVPPSAGQSLLGNFAQTCWAKLNELAVEINRPRRKTLKKSRIASGQKLNGSNCYESLKTEFCFLPGELVLRNENNYCTSREKLMNLQIEILLFVMKVNTATELRSNSASVFEKIKV